MKFSLSIRDAWYGLILLVAFLPFAIILVWGGLVFNDILLDESLQKEKVLQELIQSNVIQEVSRLTTMLENKSDPMAYTMAHGQDEVLLSELLKKVLGRESAIHVLLLLKPDGQFIAGRESYDIGPSSQAAINSHWNNSTLIAGDVLSVPMRGDIYVGVTGHHAEGMFFTIAVPVAEKGKTGAILLAEIDARILWNNVNQRTHREGIVSYVVGGEGELLIAPHQSNYQVADDLASLSIINALMDNKSWSLQKSYIGIQGKKVFGSSLLIESIGWNIVTEIEKESILRPIRELILKLATVGTIIVIIFLIIGMNLVRRIVKAIQVISKDFERITKQDFSPLKLSSSLKEIDSMVKGFNRMAKVIARKQQELNQAAIVFDNTSEGIFITNAEPKIISSNAAFTEITGYEGYEVIGKKPSILRSGQHDAEFYQQMWQVIEEDGCWSGEVQNRRKSGEVYTELLSINSFKSESGKVLQYIGVFTDISNIKAVEHKLEHLAHHDPLTNLPNRLLCNARLEQELQIAKRHDHLVAVMFLDLDMFKNINDSLGHVLGDKLLQKVTARMSKKMRDEDTIARLGGDEFVVIVGYLEAREDAASIAEGILELFSMPFSIDGHEIFIGASIGISIYPEDAHDAETSLRNADTAMYRAKSEGRNNFQFYTSDLTSDAHERLNMETYLRHAIEKNELILHYQPQYSLETGQIIAVEALLRWQHPEEGLISPDKFITVAEETGLIVPIGEWVIATACEQLIKWQSNGCPPLRMAVNLSARQFWKPGLAGVVKNILDEVGIAPSRVDLELTESIIMRDAKVTIDTLNEFHEMGFELSIDDFGTGYSSLSYLKKFPINRLKIDRSFVSDIAIEKNGDDMINSIIALGHCMDLKVLAEGVETEEQLNYLKEHGCDEVQGYFYSKPLPADDLAILCKKECC